jgi:glycosyltransferase involved in cell wall biosynthesis
MKVSIATVSLNQAAFLSEALESVLAQDHPDIEYIVVDAGSTDGSRELIDQYRDRIAHVLFEPDDGPADGLNKALRIASGKIWACVNADDLLLPSAASAAVKALENDLSLDVVYSDGYIIDAHGRVVRRERSDRFRVWRHAYGVATVMQQSTFIRRRAILSVGGYNASNRTCWDSELLLELGLAGAKMRHVNDVWGMFRLHPDSISGSQRSKRQYDADTRRLFQRALGRPWRRSDRVVMAAARGLKAVENIGSSKGVDPSTSRVAVPGTAGGRRV